MPSSNKALTVSVIIPVFNGGEMFQWCLEELSRTVPQADEVIVVADGDAESYAVAEGFDAIVVQHTANRGPAAARNTGARIATSDILFFIDADVLVKPYTIQDVLRYFQSDPNLDALIGSYDDDPSQTNFMSQYRNLFHHYTHQISYGDAATFWGACGAVRRDAFFAVGGFNEQRYNRPCIEDIELGYRLKEAGYKLRLCHDLHVKHMKKWRVHSVMKTDVFQRALPWTELLLQRRDRLRNDLNIQRVHRVSAALLCSGLLMLAIALWWPPSILMAAVLFATLFILNLSVYKFFHAKRGIIFTLKVIPLHWLYYFYSSVAFTTGFVKHKISGFKSRTKAIQLTRS